MRLLGRLRLATRIHVGLRTQVLLLGVTGVIVVGGIYFAGRVIEDQNKQIADRFARLESLTARLSESLLRGRQTATEFLQKPTDKKVAAHEETLKAAAGIQEDIEALVGSLPDGRSTARRSHCSAKANAWAARSNDSWRRCARPEIG